MKDVRNLRFTILIQPAEQASVLPKFDLAFAALLCWNLYLLAGQAFDMFHFFIFHSLDLASLFKLEFLIMADLAGIVDLAAGSLNMAYVLCDVQFRW